LKLNNSAIQDRINQFVGFKGNFKIEILGSRN